jgi:hypothetical protein
VLKFGAPLECQMPSLDDAFVQEQMIIPPFQPAAEQNAIAGTAGV